MNLIRAPVASKDGVVGIDLRHGSDTFFLPAPAAVQSRLSTWNGREVIAGIRPEQISDDMTRGEERADRIKRRAKVDVVHPTGPDTLILIELNDTPVTCRVHPETRLRSGDTAELAFDLSKLVFFDPDEETRIR
jgi:multiple sugar transport system ATP-binding protein